jgi:hypothetical protein
VFHAVVSRPLAPTRATALATPLSAYRGWAILPHCANCRVMRQLAVDRLAQQVGSGTLLRDVLPRLRCSRCGEAPQGVLLCDDGGPSRREVWLSGPEA